MNQLYYGDNLEVLRESIPDESVDLIYLDPPFNSKRDYNVLFKSAAGHQSDAQITAFEDSWHWSTDNDSQAEREFAELLHQPNTDVAEMIQSLRRFLRENDMMAYIVMMANRLLELHRVLKPTGSLYLHCDSTASHYLKIVLDSIFGKENFINEIIWRRYSRPKGSQFESRKFGMSTDTILFYGKTNKYSFYLNRIKTPLDQEEIDKRYSLADEKGGYYSGPLLRSSGMGVRPNLVFEYKGFTPGPEGWRMTKDKLAELDAQGDMFWTSSGIPRRKVRPGEEPGTTVDSLWTDIEALGAHSTERLGYPTQKPLALLERIVSASSNEGDVVLDPFCGCGTAVHAAQKLNRQWIGIDITHLAISLVEKRLKDAFPGIVFEVHGTPEDIDAARDLAQRDKYQFQWWACSLVAAQPYQGKKKGADGGTDGLIFFQDEAKGFPKKIIVSVKGGDNVTRTMIADLKNTVEREKAQMGFLVTLVPPTKPMQNEAVTAGYYESPHSGAFLKIQILTIEGLLNGSESPKYPDLARGGLNFKQARKEKGEKGQGTLFDDSQASE